MITTLAGLAMLGAALSPRKYADANYKNALFYAKHAREHLKKGECSKAMTMFIWAQRALGAGDELEDFAKDAGEEWKPLTDLRLRAIHENNTVGELLRKRCLRKKWHGFSLDGVPVMTTAQSRKREADLRRAGCDVRRVLLGNKEVVYRKCPRGAKI